MHAYLCPCRKQVDLIPSTGSSSSSSSSSSGTPSFPITNRFLSGLSYVAASALKAQPGGSSTPASNSAPAAAAGEGGREGPVVAAGVGGGDTGAGEEEQGAAGKQLADAAAQIS
ncbi:unnamed protein product, partial [Closterium sp. NIES-53]